MAHRFKRRRLNLLQQLVKNLDIVRLAEEIDYGFGDDGADAVMRHEFLMRFLVLALPCGAHRFAQGIGRTIGTGQEASHWSRQYAGCRARR